MSKTPIDEARRNLYRAACRYREAVGRKALSYEKAMKIAKVLESAAIRFTALRLAEIHDESHIKAGIT